jgi:hypothetical protein
MPTRHRRIALVADPELEAALDAARAAFPGEPEAGVVRKLALKGAEQLEHEEARRRKALEWLIEWSTAPGAMDREALARVEEEGW